MAEIARVVCGFKFSKRVWLNITERGLSHFRSSPHGATGRYTDAHFLVKASLSVNVCNITCMQFTNPHQTAQSRTWECEYSRRVCSFWLLIFLLFLCHFPCRQSERSLFNPQLSYQVQRARSKTHHLNSYLCLIAGDWNWKPWRIVHPLSFHTWIMDAAWATWFPKASVLHTDTSIWKV